MRIVLIDAFGSYKEGEYNFDNWNEIEELFDSVDWLKFHIFSIYADDQNSIDISGNISEDGLSGSLTRRGEIYITPNAPNDLTSAKLILKSFLIDRNVTFEKYFREIESQPIRPKRRENRFVRWVMILFFTSIFLVPIIYFSGDDLKFVGREAGFERATVVEVKLQSYGGRLFWQNVNYVYEIDGAVYSGTFRGDKRRGYTNVGDEFKVRYLLSDPTVSDVVGRYVKRKGKVNNSSSAAKRRSM